MTTSCRSAAKATWTRSSASTSTCLRPAWRIRRLGRHGNWSRCFRRGNAGTEKARDRRSRHSSGQRRAAARRAQNADRGLASARPQDKRTGFHNQRAIITILSFRHRCPSQSRDAGRRAGNRCAVRALGAWLQAAGIHRRPGVPTDAPRRHRHRPAPLRSVRRADRQTPRPGCGRC